MALGSSRTLNVLQQSPLDCAPRASADTGSSPEPETKHWVPSRFNVRARTEDGGLVVWNTFRGAMSVFEPQQRQLIEEYLRRPGFSAPAEGMVRYLLDRGFLVAQGVDEYRRLRLSFGRQHYRSDVLELILLASEDCNFRCPYCYEDFNRGTMEPWVRKAVRKLVESRAPTLHRLKVNWFGGEPLYGFAAIEELAPFFAEIAERHSLRLASSMTTNGYLLTPEIAEKLLAWNVRGYQITIDGPPEFHDRSRPTREGGETFAVILENLRSLRQLQQDFAVDLRVNVDRNNHPRIPEFLDFLASEFEGDHRFRLRFHAVGKWGGPNDAELDTCGVDESPEILFELREQARRRGLQGAAGLHAVQGSGSQVCYAARPYNFIVGANGNLMKCTIDLDKKDRNIVGKISPDGQLRLHPDKLARWTEPAFEDDKKCQKCVVLPVCQGMFCPQIRFDHDKSPCTPLRLQAKKELLMAQSAASGRHRTVEVDTSAEP